MAKFSFRLKKVSLDRVVDSAVIWQVKWNILRHSWGEGCLHLVKAETMFRAFYSKQDAEDFVKALKEANILIQNKTYLCIKITKLTEENT